MVAAERGHKVTLYEKNDFLGGQLRHTDFASFKWPLRKLKDYLIRQMYKAGVQVLLNTRATPEMIKAKGYDAILVAIGADPFIPDIPGAKSSNVLAPIFVFGNETVGTNVVVIGGGKQIGTETGMYLAQKGHKVTVLTEEKSLATDANQVHFIDSLRSAWEALHTFSYVTEVTATRISEGKVFYKDATGAENSIQADSVVIYAGRKPRQDEALKFYGSAERFFAIGDCRAQGDVRICMRNAFAAASQI
jgi:NADPH-dependent 2,4-dienoyl-CoA reductase/sulfur reductase-like enzyme